MFLFFAIEKNTFFIFAAKKESSNIIKYGKKTYQHDRIERNRTGLVQHEERA